MTTFECRAFKQIDGVQLKDLFGFLQFGVEQRSVPGTAADKPVIRSRWDNVSYKEITATRELPSVGKSLSCTHFKLKCTHFTLK